MPYQPFQCLPGFHIDLFRTEDLSATVADDRRQRISQDSLLTFDWRSRSLRIEVPYKDDTVICSGRQISTVMRPSYRQYRTCSANESISGAAPDAVRAVSTYHCAASMCTTVDGYLDCWRPLLKVSVTWTRCALWHLSTRGRQRSSLIHSCCTTAHTNTSSRQSLTLRMYMQREERRIFLLRI